MHICMFACLGATIGSVRRGDATQTGVARHTAIGGACVQCLARGSTRTWLGGRESGSGV